MKKWIFLLVLTAPLAFHLFALFFLHFNENFQVNDFEHGFQKNYATVVSGVDTSLLDPILNQPFHYLGAGKQMVAFESACGRYVLKLFNPMRPLKKEWYKEIKFWKRYSSLNWITREWFQKEKRFQKLFTRHKLAFEHLKEETGLIFVHLSPSKQITHHIHVTDNRGKKQTLSLSMTPFVLQKKATLVPEYLSNLIQAHDIDAAMRATKKLQKLFEKRINVGITDRIQSMGNNYGFAEDKPIQIDVGRIHFNPALIVDGKEERARVLNNLHSWLSQKFPELIQEN